MIKLGLDKVKNKNRTSLTDAFVTTDAQDKINKRRLFLLGKLGPTEGVKGEERLELVDENKPNRPEAYQ